MMTPDLPHQVFRPYGIYTQKTLLFASVVGALLTV